MWAGLLTSIAYVTYAHAVSFALAQSRSRRGVCGAALKYSYILRTLATVAAGHCEYFGYNLFVTNETHVT